MEPEELLEETEVSQTITTEYAAKSLLADLKGVLADPKEIDENKAKQLRKAWDELQSQTSDRDVDCTALESGFEKLRLRIHKQVELRNKSYAILEGLLKTLSESIAKEELQEAQVTEKKIINGLNKIRGLSNQRRQKVIGALESLQPKMKKLSSWRHWWTEQAREKIIQEIQQIHEKEKSLEKVAQFIKQAREEWKQWDNSGEGGNKTLYKQFDAACSKAYEPCKALFDQQRKQREASSRHRKQVCELLESDYEKVDWRNPDWKKLQTLMREQSGRWRKLGPAEFRDRKPLQKRFEAAAQRFDGPLDRERKRNLKQREDLIESILKLVEMDDSRKAIGELQAIKKQWVVSVSGARKKEQAIWNKFTKACDAVYEKSRESKKAFEQELEQHFTARMALCDEIEADLKTNTFAPNDLSKQINKWRNQWSEFGRVPKAKTKQSQKRWNDVLGRSKALLSSMQRESQNKSDEQLFAFAKICSEVENGLIENQSVDLEQMKQQWNTLAPLPSSIMTKLNARFEHAINSIESKVSSEKTRELTERNFETLNHYLLQLELNLGVDSPDEFSRQRMALQISRLSAALGKAGDEAILDNQQLVYAIHSLGPIMLDRQAESMSRFQSCYKSMQSVD